MQYNVDIARTLMADSLGFHIIFAMLGVGLPAVMLIIEHLGLRRKNEIILEYAKRLSMVSIILVVAGVASGTVIALQMALVWGGLIHFGGSVLGFAFGWEGYAFIIESVFLAFYVTTWGKIKRWRHWWIGVGVAFGSLGSAVAITISNAWMQDPGLLNIVNGMVVESNPLSAIMTSTAYFMTTHSIAGYYLATILCVIGAYSVYYIKYKPTGGDQHAIKAIMFRLTMAALLLTVFLAVIGHLQTQYLSVAEPRKFAAMESVQSTTADAPYIIGGSWTSDGKVEGGIKISGLLSLLAGNSTSKEVKGIDSFNKADWPILIINFLFEIKMVFVTIVTAVVAVFGVLNLKRINHKLRRLQYSRPLLILLIMSGPVMMVVIELGWMVAELGRQPFAVNGYLRTADAYSASGPLQEWGYLFPVSYLFLFIITIAATWVVVKRSGRVVPSKGLL